MPAAALRPSKLASPHMSVMLDSCQLCWGTDRDGGREGGRHARSCHPERKRSCLRAISVFSLLLFCSCQAWFLFWEGVRELEFLGGAK